MEKMDMQTPDFTDENIAKIAELFPSCVTESAEGGVKAIDFDLLRQELSDNIIEGPQERYRLDWPGIVTVLLKACEDNKKSVIDACSHLKLIPAEELISERIELYSIRQIIEKAEKYMLFRPGRDMGKALQGSLDVEGFLLIIGSEPEILLDGMSIPSCNMDACQKILNTKPRLKAAPCRVDLLKYIIKEGFQVENKKVIRYLLHGKREWFDDDKLLLAVRSHDAADVCTKMASQLKMLDEEAWTFIDPSLTELINPQLK